MKVKLVAVATGEEVVAEIRPARLEDILLWQEWLDRMPADAEDGHWRWDRLILVAELHPDELACFILLAEGKAQGLMLLELEHENELGERDVHGLRLSTAPWNRGPSRRYKGVGTMMLTKAVLTSIEWGYEGRLWLEALPGAETFYRRAGMIELPGRDPAGGLRRFRFDAETAQAFLKAGKGQGDE